MILPTIRASFDRGDARHLVDLFGRDPELRKEAEARLDEHGIDALLDDPRVLNALLTQESVKAPPELIFYVLVRHALLEGGLDSRSTADFVASVVVAFSRSDRAYRPSEESGEEYHYLVDVVERLSRADEREAFILRAHLGNFSLWLSGLFPDFLESRVRRRGAPSIDYYERMGATGYLLASESRQAQTLGVEHVFRGIARDFQRVRTALNRLSDRYMWGEGAEPVGRLLREVAGRMEGR